MKPLSLRLKGFIGIKKGRGVDEISIDFSDMAGLIAFDGKNGAGKSTILENCSPYRQLASRNGALSHHVFLRDSEKEYSFEFDGNAYRTLVKIDSQSGRQEGFIWKDDEPQVNGKVAEYDKYIENLIGSPTLFFNSVFAAQGGAKLSDMTPAKLKALFSEFLRLDRLIEWEETAKLAGNEIQAQIDQTDKIIEVYRGQSGDLSQIQEELTSKQAEHDEWNKELSTLSSDKDAATKSLENLKAEADNAKAVAAKKDELEFKKGDLAIKINGNNLRLKEIIGEYETKKAGIEMEVVKRESILKSRDTDTLSQQLESAISAQGENNKKKADIESEIASIREKIDSVKKEAEQEEVEVRAILDAEIGDKRSDLAKAEKERDAARGLVDSEKSRAEAEEAEIRSRIEKKKAEVFKLELSLKELESAISKAESEIEKLQNDPQIKVLENHIKNLAALASKTEVCEFKSETCPLLKDAIDAKRLLPQKQTELSEKQTSADGETIKIKERLAKDEITLNTLTNDIGSQKAEINELVEVRLASVKEKNTKTLRGLFETVQKMTQEVVLISSQITDAENNRTKAISDFKAQAAQKANGLEQEKTARIDALRLISDALAINESAINAIQEKIKNRPNYEVIEAEILSLKEKLLLNGESCRNLIQHIEDANSEFAKEIEAININIASFQIRAGIAVDIAEKQEVISKLETREKALRAMIGGAASKIAILEHQISEAKTAEEKIKSVMKQRDFLLSELSDWRYLQQACGKDGLRALEIDGTAPLIAGYANDLLAQTFGPGQTIGFRTQSDEGKEILDIVVYRDGDDADGILLDKLSGGEKVWCLKALRLALTMVAKSKSGRDFQAAFADEEDGALDSENAKSFIEMYRFFMREAGFGSCFFITHRDECKAMSDHLIKLTDNGVELN